MKNFYFLLLLALLNLRAIAQVGIGTVSPNSTLDLRGSFSAAYRSFTTATSLIASDHTLVFTGGSATTATLPDATTCQGRIYCIKNFSAGPVPAALTLNTVSAQKIDGLASWILGDLNETMMIGSDGANWEVLDQSSPVTSAATTGGSWNEGGNSVTAIKSIGTISNYDFPFITNNTEKMRITGTGYVGIGSTAFSANPEALLVYQNNATSFNVIAGKGSLNNYLQLNIQNLNSGTNASSDVVATADNGNELTNYVDLGMNSSGNTSGVMGAPDDAYLYTAGNNFLVGTANAGKALVFMTGGTSQATNERMRIDGTGNMGIGNNSPGYLLDVNGAIHTGKASATSGSLVFSNSTNVNTVTLNTGVTTATYAITLPVAQGGANTVLENNGAGVLSWTTVAAAANTWSTLGNAGTTPGTNFLGTTDNQSLVFKANNLLAGKIDLSLNNALFGSLAGNAVTTGINNTAVGYSALKANTTGGSNAALGNSAGLTNTTGSNNTFVGTNADATVVGLSNATAIGYNAKVASSNTLILGGTGANVVNVGMGTNTFNVANPEKLVVDAGVTTSVNAIVGKGTINNYLQLNIQNLSNGASASSDVVATADNGNETSNYVDMGVNGSANASGVMGNPDDAYLYNIGQNFLFGTGTAAKSLVFMTGGTSQATNERMRIDGSGNLGLGTNAPSQKLDVNGNFQLSGAFMPGNTAGTAGFLLMSTGAGGTPTWFDPNSYLGFSTWIPGGNNFGSVQKLGTTANFDLPVITNNIERMRIMNNGNVAIDPPTGIATFNATNPEKLLVDAGTTTSVNAIVGKGNNPTYLQLNIQNLNNGGNASSDVVATADNGNETTNYVDLGMNSSGNTSGVMGAADDAYLYTTGNNFLIGTATAAKSLIFLTGGTTQGTNERMRITGTGDVGIGTTTPNSILQVGGSMALPTVTKTISYTVLATDYTVLCNNTSGAITISLPTAAGITGRIYVIKKISGAGNNVTVDGFGAETIDGAATNLITIQYNSIMIQSDGTNWYILSKN